MKMPLLCLTALALWGCASSQPTVDTRVYDIRDLLVQIPGYAGPPEFDLNSALG